MSVKPPLQLNVTLYVLLAAYLAADAVSQGLNGFALKQPHEGEPAQILSAAERGQLGDPVFNLVLKEHADVVDFGKIEELIQPDVRERHTFVVDEEIANPKQNQARRSVITFTGSNHGEVLTSNAMLSVFFDATAFPSPISIEAWGWDNVRGRYNYYKLDKTGTPDDRLTWKFRASSVAADMLTPPERRNTCLACHINGGPIMKELSFPWNNWHSFASQATYLISPQGWPVSNNPALAGGRLQGAETLETDGILPSIRQFNNRRINEALARRDIDGNVAINEEGAAQVVDGKRLLKPLFVTTEYNIISGKQKSQLHPFSPRPPSMPAGDVEIPNSFFLNANLMAGGTPANYLGLGIPEAANFSKIAKVHPKEYKSLIEDSGVQLGGVRPGDADFAWFVPEPSHMDNDMVDRLIRRGIVSKDFVASILMIDLEKPVLSGDRESLLQFIPEKFSFIPLKPGEAPAGDARTDEDLRKKVIGMLEAAHVAADSNAGRWLQNLKSGDAINRLHLQVTGYLKRIQDALADPQTRPQQLKKLYDLAIERRQAVLQNALLNALNETGDRLFPVPETFITNPHHQR